MSSSKSNDATGTPRSNGFAWIIALAAVLVILATVSDATTNTKAPDNAVSIDWQTDLDAALEKSGETKTPVLIDFMSPWCPPCQVMDHRVWSEDEVVQDVEKTAIPLRADVSTPEGVLLAKRYEVQALPTLLLVNAQGEEVSRRGFLSSEALLDYLHALPSSQP